MTPPTDSDHTLPVPRLVTRRDFLLASAASVASIACAGRTSAPSAGVGRAGAGGVVLFQGDSITDSGRNRSQTAPNVTSALGNGYALLVAAAVLRAEPSAPWRFFNRGISGHKVPDLQARWDADTVALRPDVLSILIGVNDYWHKRDGRYDGTVAQYESQYDALLVATRRALPNVRLVVLEPFVVRVGAVDATWFPEFDERRAAAARVARRAGATFVPLHDELQAMAVTSGAAHWAADGVHPSAAGNAFIAERWRAATGI